MTETFAKAGSRRMLERKLVVPLAAGLMSAGVLATGCGNSEASQAPSQEVRGEAPAANTASNPVPEVAREIEPSVVQVNVSSIQTTP